MADEQPDIMQSAVSAMRAYQNEVQSAYAEKDKTRQRALVDSANKRFQDSIRNVTASKAVIDSFGEFVKAVQGKEVEAIGALVAATQGRITSLQTLQREQAELLMNTLTAPDKAVSGIASFGMTIATICRFFGADDFAKQIEDKSNELMDGVHDRMKARLDQNSKEFASQHDENELLAETAKEMQERFSKSKAPQTAANIANHAPTGMPTATAPYRTPNSVAGSSATANANTPITMNEFKKNLEDLGLSKAQIAAFIPAMAKSARLSGDKMTLDSDAEAQSIINSDAMKSLEKSDPAKAKKVSDYVSETSVGETLTPNEKLIVTVSQNTNQPLPAPALNHK